MGSAIIPTFPQWRVLNRGTLLLLASTPHVTSRAMDLELGRCYIYNELHTVWPCAHHSHSFHQGFRWSERVTSPAGTSRSHREKRYISIDWFQGNVNSFKLVSYCRCWSRSSTLSYTTATRLSWTPSLRALLHFETSIVSSEETTHRQTTSP